MKVAVFSGGKDSLYAASRHWPIDLFLIFVYEFPSPSPHLENLGPSVVTGLLTGTPVVVKRLRKGEEKEDSAEFLKSIGAKELIAGDVYVEDHLKYMEDLTEMCGAKLSEPLWGEDPEEILEREMEWGIDSLIVGTVSEADSILGRRLNRRTYPEIKDRLKGLGLDPLGERGEYHTLVLSSPLHKKRLEVEIMSEKVFERSKVLLISPITYV